MGHFFASVDWIDVFMPQAPLIETFVRGSLLYLGLVVMLRLTPAREAGAVGTPDLLVILLLADAAQNAMAGPHHAVGDSFGLLITILLWSVGLGWLGYARPPAVPRPACEPPEAPERSAPWPCSRACRSVPSRDGPWSRHAPRIRPRRSRQPPGGPLSSAISMALTSESPICRTTARPGVSVSGSRPSFTHRSRTISTCFSV
jgi:hypothetical protein